MTRRTPSRHYVREHWRSDAPHVPSYVRGSGSRVIPYSGDYKPLKNPPKDEHGRELKKPGDMISYMDNGKRVTGIVKGVRQEYYLVERGGKIWKVDRHSIFTRIGGAVQGATNKIIAKASELYKKGEAVWREAGKEFSAPIEDVKTQDGRTVVIVNVGGDRRQVPMKDVTQFKKIGKFKAWRERRAEEREHWRRVREEMKRESKLELERTKMQAKHDRELAKIKDQIRRGPLWKRTARAVGAQASKQILGKGRRPKSKK